MIVSLLGVVGGHAHLDRHRPGDIGVATALSNHQAWFNALVASPECPPAVKTLGDLNLDPLADTLDDWITPTPPEPAWPPHDQRQRPLSHGEIKSIVAGVDMPLWAC